MKKIPFWIVVVFILICAGIIIFIIARAESRRAISVPILMYHEIGSTTNSPWCVPVETFRAQMFSLRAQGYKTILPADIIAHRKRGRPLPRKPIIITFDDGYLCNLNIVEPVLEENGFQAVVYLITALTAETPAERKNYEGKECLVWPEARAMQKRDTFAVGGHSHDHVNLAADPNPSAQIVKCFNQLKLHNIRQPYSFCYPYGEHKLKTRQAVRHAGFQTAVVCEDAIAKISPTTDVFALPRVSIMGGAHLFKFTNKRAGHNSQELVYSLSHDGIPMEISACRYGGNNEKRVWLAPREIAQGEFELLFPLSKEPEPAVPCTLEIWDKHRLFKLATINQ